MILYDGGWYYVPPDIMIVLFLSKSFTKNNNDLVIFRPEDDTLMKLPVKVRPLINTGWQEREMTPELPIAERLEKRTERPYL